jgi:hypothetical protein
MVRGSLSMRKMNSKELASYKDDDDAGDNEHRVMLNPSQRPWLRLATWTSHGFLCGFGWRYGGGCTAARVCVEEMMRQSSARPTLYTSEAVEGAARLATTLISLSKVGDDRSTGE